MHNIIGKKTQHWIAGGVLMVFAGLSHAQYLWLNEKGAKVYSDRPPPSSVPAKNILKSPGSAGAAAIKTAEGDAAAPAVPPAGDKAPPTLADRNADFKKRATERAEQEKKDSATAAQKAAERQNCESARNYKQSLDSGQRMAGVDKNGERGFMSDEQRNEASARTNKILDGCK